MTDLIDEAQEKQLADTEAALRAHHKLHDAARGKSPAICKCGEKIPLKRRNAVVGTQICMPCALRQEAERRNYRRVFA